MLAQAADNTFVVRAGTSEAISAGGSAAPASFGGVYFGAAEAGDVSEVREIIYWPRLLSFARRNAARAYLLSRSPDAA